MIFKKKYKTVFYLYSEKKDSKEKKKLSILKNLLNFFKLEKIEPIVIKSVIGIKFFLSFKKKLNSEVNTRQADHFRAVLLESINIPKILQLNSIIRFSEKKEMLKTSFFKNFIIKKNYLSKIFIEETSDKIKTYLDENLIRLILEQNPIIGRCWLWVKFDSNNNKKFWFQVINSCFSFMTTVDSTAGKSWPIKNLNTSIRYSNLKDFEFECWKSSEKKKTLFSSYDQLKNYPINSKILGRFYKSFKIEKYLKKINWRNRFFTKKKLLFLNQFQHKKKFSHCTNLIMV